MKLRLLIVVNILIFCLAVTTQAQGKIRTEIETEDYVKIFTPYRAQIKTWFANLFSDRDPPRQMRKESRADYITCDVCHLGFPIIKSLLNGGAAVETIIQTAVNLCVTLEIESREICDPTVRSYGEPVIFIIKNRPEYKMNDLCGILNPGCGNVTEELTNWEVQINPDKPPVQNLLPLPAVLATTKILQLTDIHLDVNYTVGANTACGKPLCCRDGVPETEADAAGYYGHFRCEMPPQALDVILAHAKETHETIKYVFLTGDYVHSGIYLYSPEENGRNIRAVTEAVAEVFEGIPIYPLVGNHEPDVVNMYPPEEIWDQFDLSWMYNTVSDPFTQWLDEEQLKSFKRGGYYTVNPEPGLRLVIVNTNICYTNNFWLAYDPVDPAGQLQWFADTLLAAENAGENVLILGHIAPGSGSCWPVWSDKFDKIVNRFENIIRAQFYGHSHTEHFSLAFERDTERPTSVMFTSPSAVTDSMNSGYKIFQADGERGRNSTWEIVDHETWILNITMSNAALAPVWEHLYTAKEEYGLENLRTDSLYDLVLRMVTDDDLFLRFQRNHNKGQTTRGICRPAGENFENCKLNLLCEAFVGYSGDMSHCNILEEIMNNSTSRVN